MAPARTVRKPRDERFSTGCALREERVVAARGKDGGYNPSPMAPAQAGHELLAS